MSIKANIEKVAALEAVINEHQVGGNLEFNSTHVVYIFFDTWCELNGVQVSLAKGKINALELLISKLDELYERSVAWFKKS